MPISALVPGIVTPGAGCTQQPGTTFKVLCSYSGTPRVLVDLGDGNDHLSITNDVPMRVEASGGPGDDMFTADSTSIAKYAVPTVFDGGPGDDTVYPGRGPDILRGGDGADRLDYTFSPGPTTITMNGAADDGTPGEGDNVAGDFEYVRGSQAYPNTVVGSDLNVPLDSLGNGQYLTGGDAADTIDGGGGNDLVSGGPGNDTLRGGAGDDGLLGEEGNDRLDGGPGADDISGDTGNDTLLARDAESDLRLSCDEGTDTAVVDNLLDGRIEDCERVDAAWSGPPRTLVEALTPTARHGRLRLPVTCLAAAGTRCKGRLTVRTLKCVRAHGHCRKVVLGRAKVSLTANRRRTLVVRVSSRASRALRRGSRASSTPCSAAPRVS